LPSCNLLLRRFVRLPVGHADDLKSDVEVVLLRHQLMVLERHVGRPAFIAAIGCSWPR